MKNKPAVEQKQEDSINLPTIKKISHKQEINNSSEINLPTNKDLNIKFALSKSALQDVSSVATETREQAENNSNQFVKLKDNTIKQLVDFGIKDLPMLERRGHVRENILTEEQAKQLGFSIKNKHFHGLGVKTYLEIIDSMDNPIAIYQYTDKGKYSDDNFIVVTPFELDGHKAIVPVEINKKGQYNQVEIDFNKIKSSYLETQQDYLQKLLKEDKIKETFTQSSAEQTSLVKDNISQNNKNVNNNILSTKYSMSTKQKNTQELDNSSFSYGNNIQGLENYSKDEIKSLSTDYIKQKLEENDLYDIEIKDIDIHGSRNRGTVNDMSIYLIH